jgi:HlyD family secretion protein
MKNLIAKSWKGAMNHKFVSIVVAAAVLGGGYYAYGKMAGPTQETRYVLAAVQKGTLVSSVSASGQVSVINQFDLKPRVSGNVVSVKSSEGQDVKSGTLIVQLDSTDAEKAVRDAEANLESAKISFQKLVQPADALSLIQAENALTQVKQSKKNAQDDLLKAYDDSFNAVSSAFTNLPDVITGLDGILFGTTVNGSQSNVYAYYNIANGYKPNADQFRDTAIKSYQEARTAFDKNLQNYKNVSRSSDRSIIEVLVDETYATTIEISDAIKDVKNLIDLANDALNAQNVKIPSVLTSHQNSLQSYTSNINNNLSTLLNVKNTIKSDENSLMNADLSITEKTEALAKLKAGPDPLDIRSQELSVKQRENALLDAKDNLNDYFIRAPFDGTVAKIAVKKGDPASSGSAVATIITNQKIAQISLNEVDIAKVALGQKATLTFDAFPDLTITGKVTQIDTIGTVTQGVVNYSVTIAFETDDDRIKPSMSVSAAVVTDVRQDVLLVPNAAVKSQGETRYVEILDGVENIPTNLSNQGVASKNAPRQEAVEIGTSNDSTTEITSGLQEGDLVVMRSLSAQQVQTQASGLGGIRIPGITGGTTAQPAGGTFR